MKDNLRYRGIAGVSVTIFAVNVFVYLYETMLAISGRMESVLSPWGSVHDSFVSGLASGDLSQIMHAVLTLLSSMFMHQNFMHILGNMCFFFTFAPALEARMGHLRFLLFYLTAGVVATLAFMFTDPTGAGHGMGASGAIGGVLGAYLVYFPRARINGWSPLLTPFTSVGAFFLTDFFLMQWLSIWQQSHMAAGEAAGVAYWAHIGGIAFGMIVGAVMGLSDAGRLKRKDIFFFILACEVVCLPILAKLMLPRVSFALTAVLSVLVGLLVYLKRYKHGSAPWYRSLTTPLTTMLVGFMVVCGLEQFVEMCLIHASDWYTVHVGVISGLAMLGSIIVAAAASKLPRVKPAIVVVPAPKEGERILGEQVADLVIGFCRLISGLVIIPCSSFALAVERLTVRLGRKAIADAVSKGSSI
jgi:membrane associated rhomboid family serine protease